MQLSNYRQSTLTLSYKKVRITNVDPEMGFLEGRDSADVAFQITFTFFHSPYTQVPKLGENWLITRLDNNWVLHSRFEDGSETTPIASLTGGDVRIEAPDQLYLNAGYEIIADFNKAAPSFANLGTATFPGSALYGSATLDQVNAGTVVIQDRLVCTILGYLPTRNIVEGQEETILVTNSGNDNPYKIVWRFICNEKDSDHPWRFIGGPPYFVQVSASGTCDSQSSTWSGGTPMIRVPVDGDYIFTGGGIVTANANNITVNLGISVNGSAPVETITGFVPSSGIAIPVNNSVYLSLKKNDVLTGVFQGTATNTSGKTITISRRSMSITPIRCAADPLDDPEPVVETPYTGAG